MKVSKKCQGCKFNVWFIISSIHTFKFMGVLFWTILRAHWVRRLSGLYPLRSLPVYCAWNPLGNQKYKSTRVTFYFLGNFIHYFNIRQLHPLQFIIKQGIDNLSWISVKIWMLIKLLDTLCECNDLKAGVSILNFCAFMKDILVKTRSNECPLWYCKFAYKRCDFRIISITKCHTFPKSEFNIGRRSITV